jgi:hypothetical protein
MLHHVAVCALQAAIKDLRRDHPLVTVKRDANLAAVVASCPTCMESLVRQSIREALAAAEFVKVHISTAGISREAAQRLGNSSALKDLRAELLAQLGGSGQNYVHLDVNKPDRCIYVTSLKVAAQNVHHRVLQWLGLAGTLTRIPGTPHVAGSHEQQALQGLQV